MSGEDGSGVGAETGAQAPPKFIRPNFDRMPPELKTLKNWVLWAAVWNGTKWTKRPIQISGHGASTTNPKHWSTFDDVEQAYERAVQRGYMELQERGKPAQQVAVGGVGFVFDGQPDEDGLVFAGADFDKVIPAEGEISSFAAERVKRLGSYYEQSVSGAGLHVILKARPLARGITQNGTELYTGGRFFTMTGRAPQHGKIIAASEAFAALADELQVQTMNHHGGLSARPPDNDEQPADGGTNAWFGKLSPERQGEVVRHAALHIASNSKLFELTEHGGNYREYLRLALAIARSGAEDAEAIFVEAASTAKNAESQENLRQFFQACKSAEPHTDGVTAGTLFHIARQQGANFDNWKCPAAGAAAADQTNDAKWPDWPYPLDFHQVPAQEAIARVNAAGYFVLTLNGDIYKVEPGGGVTVQKREGFNNLFASRRAINDEIRSTSAGAVWKSSPKRREHDNIGYWPGGSGCSSKSYNLWQGWGIEPKEGDWSIIDHHVLDVLACGDKVKADYILDWCAHMVQRPREKPGVALVFRGRKGTGKTLLTLLVAAAIGRRNALITASGKKLFGNFNWHLADKLLIGAEEAFFVGNRELNDQLKHLLTGDDIEVEQKFGQRISMKSMHRMIMTSNHDQVISASDDERRFFVCDVSERHRGDDAYFAPLVAVTKCEDDFTLAAFLYELQTRDIKNWNPERAAREAASTGSDLARQKLLSLEPPLQWLLEQNHINVPRAAKNTAEDVGYSDASDLDLDQRIFAKTASIPNEDLNEEDATREQQRTHMLESYRQWVKTAQVRGASDFTSAEIFWASIKRLLNGEIFPGRKLFRSSGGTRWVLLPPRQEMLDGFNRLLGGKVLDADEGP
jgi:Family of unknown function (DUF5906)/Primase C terminal 2 (PriCT-2)